MLVPHRPNKDLTNEVAEKLNVDSDLVEKITGFYWGEMKRAIVSGEYLNIIIQELCTLSVRPRKVQKLLDNYKKRLTNIQPTSFVKQHIIQEYKRKIEILENLNEQLEAEKQKQESIKHKRDEFKNSMGT